MTDAVSPFAELIARHDVDEVFVRRSRFGFMAFHGGALEVGTDVIAGAAAEASGASYYGVHHGPDALVHIPSIKVDPAVSPPLAEFLDHVEVVIAVHGYGRAGHWTSMLLGGTNRELAHHVAAHLAPHLPDYELRLDLDTIPVELRGLHPDNPVNRPRRAGVQLELPPRARGLGPLWADWAGPGPAPHAAALIAALTAAANSWPI